MSSIPADPKQADAQQETLQVSVPAFVQAIRSRLNRQRLFADMIWTAFFGGLVMTGIAVAYVWPGYTVPPFWYLVVFPTALLSGLMLALFHRVSRDDAAHFADKFFGLKDAVRSCVGFEDQGRSGDFVELQAHQTEGAVRAQEISKIRFRFPPGIAFLAVAFCAASAVLAFRGPSEEIREQLAKENQMLESTLAINEQITELVDELEKSLDDEEKKLIKPDELRKWVDELRQTKDPKEAMRQYAKLERKINKASMALQQRRDEDLLTAAGEELTKDRKNKELGEKLKQKKYELAAKDLEKLKPSENQKEGPKAKLSEKRKELAKLKAAAKRMQQAVQKLGQGNNKRTASKSAVNKNSAKSSKSSRNSKSSNSSDADENADESEMDDESELEELLEELDEAVEDYDEILEKAEQNDEDRDDQDLEECEACRNAVGDKLDELQKKLRKLASKRKARSKLKKLAQQCANCQSALVQSRRKGGKRAGKGTDDTIRDTKDPLINNDQYTRLKGLKGRGPALTKVEAADDGTGVSGRKATARKRDFVRQFESFVQREDVPEELKRGVKNYFTEIHQGEQKPENQPAPAAEKQ